MIVIQHALYLQPIIKMFNTQYNCFKILVGLLIYLLEMTTDLVYYTGHAGKAAPTLWTCLSRGELASMPPTWEMTLLSI